MSKLKKVASSATRRRGEDKKIPLLESSFEEILVCKKNNLRSRIEVFIQKPENISQQNLGNLSGIFEITDDSEDSSYIVNYLVSVIKKEYYSREKRGSVESFEAALHKTNLALAKMAEHGNTGWIGKINAIISITEKNNIHIAQTGKVKALLLRGKTLTNISEGSTENETSNPLKTFVDVLSGRLEKDDKIILTTEDIFEIFSFEEIKKSALKFSDEAFIQFLKTALVNELEKASVLIIGIKEKELPKEVPVVLKNDTELNAFSQASFSKYTKKETAQKNITSGEKQNIINEIKEDLKKESSEFIDKKTGHIYIKEDCFLKNKESFLVNLWENYKEILFSKFKKEKSVANETVNETVTVDEPAPEILEEKIEIKATEKIKKDFGPYLKKIIQKIGEIFSKMILLFQNYLKIGASKIKIFSKIVFANLKKISLFIFSFSSNQTKKIIEKIKARYEKKEVGYSNEEISLLTEKTTSFEENIPTKQEPQIKEEKKAFFPDFRHIFSEILPKFSRIKNLFSNLNYPQKIYAFFIILILLIAPYIFVKFENRKKEMAVVPSEETPAIQLPLENDKNVSRITNLSQASFEKEIKKIINLNDKIFLINKNEMIDAENKETYPIPSDFSEIETASNMDDLNLIFIANKANKILSWSPTSKKFRDNQIILPEKTTISFQETYLTYLYILDKTNNQIYRYPRAEGGFGVHKNWLKESVDLNNVSEITIGENIFMLEKNGNLSMFYQGKKQPFAIEETSTPIKVDKLYTKRKSQNLYILDKLNSRIIKLDLNGKIISQFHNLEIAQASDFEVIEETNVVYFSIGNKLLNFKI